jgi:hypothetical protein
MVGVPVSELVGEVRITIDENSVQSEYLASDSDNLELDELIRSKLPDAIRAIHEIAPNRLIEGVPYLIDESDQHKNTDGTGHVKVPDDFLRLVLFDMRSWRMPVYAAINDNSDEYAMQKNVFTRGSASKPVCALTQDIEGNRILEYYSAGLINDGTQNLRDHRIRQMVYLPMPSINNDMVQISSSLRAPIVNYCAGLVMVSRGDPQHAEAFFNIAKSFFEV